MSASRRKVVARLGLEVLESRDGATTDTRHVGELLLSQWRLEGAALQMGELDHVLSAKAESHTLTKGKPKPIR